MSAFVFDSAVAKEYGVNGAVMIHCMQFWIAKNKVNNKHFYDGHYWMYNSVDAFTKLLPFFTAKQIRGILDKLITAGVLITKNYNTKKYDKTLWYAFANEDRFLPDDNQNPFTNQENPFAQTVKPIPDSITDSINNPLISPLNEETQIDGGSKVPQRGPSDISVTASDLYSFWNDELLPGRDNVAKIRTTVNHARVKNFYKLLKLLKDDQKLETYEQAFELFKEQITCAYDNSRYLQGKAPGRKYKFTLDFCLSPEYFTSMVEGRYDD